MPYGVSIRSNRENPQEPKLSPSRNVFDRLKLPPGAVRRIEYDPRAGDLPVRLILSQPGPSLTIELAADAIPYDGCRERSETLQSMRLET